MMLYTTKEQKELLRRIVEDYDNPEKLGDKFILRMILDITGNAAVEWNIDNEEIVLHNSDSKQVLSFIGCIGLIDSLLKDNLIYIHSQKNNSTDKSVIATNAMTIGQAYELFGDLCDIFKDCKFIYTVEGKSGVPTTNITKIRTNICLKTESFSNSFVYPMPYLVDYVNNGFNTEEQMRFEKQMNDTQEKHKQAMHKTQETLCYTRCAFFAALIPSLFSIHSFFADMTIRDLNTTIKEQKFPEVINASLTNDTIKAFVVNPQNETEPIVKK